MATKTFDLDNIGSVQVNKRRGSRNVRLSITPKGIIRVTIPAWSSYLSGVEFARSRADWIQRNMPAQTAPLQSGHRVGKAHQLIFMSAAIDAPSSRIAGSEIRVSRPLGMAPTHQAVQRVAERAAIRALRSQAEALLPKRLRQLADQHGFDYNSVQIKQLKGRWGSCDNLQNIVLNLFLMQLPWDLIDYVLLHELTHTRQMNHGPEFWAEFARHEPCAKMLRSQVKSHQPALMPELPFSLKLSGSSQPAMA